MNITAVQLDDITAVYQSICALEENELPLAAFSSCFQKALKDSTLHYIAARHEGEWLGFASVRIVEHLHHAANIAMIEELYVESNYRQQGIGTALFQHILGIAKAHDCIQVELSSHHKRTNAHRFYEHQGMKNQHYKFTIDL